jgi:hypothetical protein
VHRLAIATAWAGVVTEALCHWAPEPSAFAFCTSAQPLPLRPKYLAHWRLVYRVMTLISLHYLLCLFILLILLNLLTPPTISTLLMELFY